MNVALILCGGKGNRFGGELPKQYMLVDGRMCVEYVIAAACQAKRIERVVVCAAPPYEHLLPLQKRYDFDLTPSRAIKDRLRSLNAKAVCFFLRRILPPPARLFPLAASARASQRAATRSMRFVQT